MTKIVFHHDHGGQFEAFKFKLQYRNQITTHIVGNRGYHNVSVNHFLAIQSLCR